MQSNCVSASFSKTSVQKLFVSSLSQQRNQGFPFLTRAVRTPGETRQWFIYDRKHKLTVVKTSFERTCYLNGNLCTTSSREWIVIGSDGELGSQVTRTDGNIQGSKVNR